MELSVSKADGAGAAANIQVSDQVFGAAFNEALVHQVVTAYLAGARAGTKAQKNRSDVSGGGAKPWRQKGMGRARAGSTRSPLWRKGGVTFAARPRSYAQKVNRKMYRGAVAAILSELVRQERLLVVDGIALESARTKLLAQQLKSLGLDDVLIVTDEVDENLYLAARNIPKVDVRDVAGVDPVSLIGHERVVMTAAAVKQLEESLS